MARSSTYTRDPVTGKWVKGKGDTTKNGNSKNGTKPSKPSKPSKPAGRVNKKDNVKKNTNKNTSKGKETSKTTKSEYYTLSGTVNYIPNQQTIKLKPGDTVKLSGIGKYLKGRYYVQDVTRSLSSSGYTQSMTVLKNNFRSTLKKKKTKKTK